MLSMRSVLLSQSGLCGLVEKVITQPACQWFCPIVWAASAAGPIVDISVRIAVQIKVLSDVCAGLW
jgi:hypothetical protein